MCGAPLARRGDEREVRKTVTVVFCDLVGSTARADGRAPEAVRAFLAGAEERLRAWEVVAVAPGAAGLARRLDTPLVGRSSELRLLEDAFARVARERRPHLFTVLGPPGVGKSRLVAELGARVGDRATVLAG